MPGAKHCSTMFAKPTSFPPIVSTTRSVSGVIDLICASRFCTTAPPQATFRTFTVTPSPRNRLAYCSPQLPRLRRQPLLS